MANYDWLTKGGGKTVNPLNDPYFGTGGPQSPGQGGYRGGTDNGGASSLGNGNGTGYMNWGGVAGNEAFYTDATNPGGDNETPATVDPKALDAWLKSNNYKLKDSGVNGGTEGYRWIEDASGNVVGEPTAYSNKDGAFQAAVLAATAAVTAGVSAAGGTLTAAPGAAGGGGSGLLSGMDLAADAAIGSGNNITTAAGMLGGDTVAIGGGDALIDEIASEAASGAGDAAAGATGGTSTPGYSAASGYGSAGMSGGQTGMFDTVLSATGSKGLAAFAADPLGGLANAASSAWDWLGSSSTVSAGGKLFGNTLATEILKLVGAGVLQSSAEGATEDQREWIEKQQADRRRRQKPAKTPGMFTTATRGTNG